jgi:hypothetical protein
MITGLIIAGNVILYLVWVVILFKFNLKEEGITSYEEFEKFDFAWGFFFVSLFLAVIAYLPGTVFFPFYLLLKKYKKPLVKLLLLESPEKKPEIKKLPESFPVYGETNSYRELPSIVRK